jgi:hypothetical protein
LKVYIYSTINHVEKCIHDIKKKKKFIRGEIEAGTGEGRGEQKAVERRDSKNQND